MLLAVVLADTSNLLSFFPEDFSLDILITELSEFFLLNEKDVFEELVKIFLTKCIQTTAIACQ